MIEVKNEASLTKIYVTGEILDDTWKGWNWGEDENTYPSNIRDILKDSKDKDVEVYISSPGGDLFAGVAISNILKRHKKNTKAIIDGIAASSASIIAFGCKEIEIPKNGYLMIHKPSCGVFGNADDLLKLADTLDTLQKGLVETYKTKAIDGVTDEDINKLINDETWFTGDDVKKYFNVTVTGEKDIKNSYKSEIKNFKNVPEKLKDFKEENEDSKELERKKKEIELMLTL